MRFIKEQLLDKKAIFIGSIVLLYGGLWVFLNYLQFPIQKDELHFWPTSLLFSHTLVPPLEQLRDYPELSTPLSFVIFGVLEYLFHGGISNGRLLNLILSFFIIYLIGTVSKKQTGSSILAACGLLLFPYYLGVSVHLYTDIIATFFVLLGVLTYFNEKYILSCISFILAISSRQYMIAFPLALCAAEWFYIQKKRKWFRIQWLSPFISTLSLVLWFWFFGGFAPKTELMKQNVATASLVTFFPNNGLYFLACIGLFFVLLEFFLFRRWINFRKAFTLKNGYFALGLGVLFATFPPFGNIDYSIVSMGYLDKVLRLLGNNFLRITIFYVLALFACIRFSRFNLPFWFLLMNTLIMMKAHIAWDKYILPLLVVLWYLKATGVLDEDVLSYKQRKGNGLGLAGLESCTKKIPSSNKGVSLLYFVFHFCKICHNSR